MGLVEPLRGKVIRALADLDVFADSGALRELVQAAVLDVPRAKNFINGIEFRGTAQALARRLVVKAEPLGNPPGEMLARILGELLASEPIAGEPLLVLNAALERLRSRHTASPGDPSPVTTSTASSGEPTPATALTGSPGEPSTATALTGSPGEPSTATALTGSPGEPSTVATRVDASKKRPQANDVKAPDAGALAVHYEPPANAPLARPRAGQGLARPRAGQGLVMVSFSHRDFDAVKTLIAELRQRGVRATWDQDQAPGSDIPVWVWSTYQRADWVVLACSTHYYDSVEGLLRNPVAAPSTGKGVAQEARFMASEHIHHGPERFVPVLLPGSEPHHIPLLAQGKLRFSVPDQYDELARRLREPRSRRASTGPDEDGDKEPEPATTRTAGDAIVQPPEDVHAPVDSVNTQPPAVSEAEAITPLDRVRQRQIDDWREADDRRHERFIELELMPQADVGAQAAKPETFTSLEALIGAVSEPAILLVGAPGAGKTTLLRHLCYALAEADFGTDSRRVVFFLPLAEYPKKNGPGLDAWFAERFARGFPSLGPFDAALAAGQVWLLLDGLNEMAYGDAPNDRFDDLRDALHRLPRANRVIVTCREQDVTGSLGRVRRAEVKPLSAEAVERFLTKYAPQKAEGAYQALVSHDLLALYQNPYRLRLLVDELLEDGTIPPNRAALFSSQIGRALRHNLQAAGIDQWLGAFVNPRTRACLNRGELPKPHTPTRVQGELLPALSRLAFDWQIAGPGQHRWWPIEDALSALDADDEDRADALLRAGRAILVLDEREAEGEVRFGHQQLQEYFAARHWAATDDDRAFAAADKGERIGDRQFLEKLETIVERLGAGERLPARPATGWEETAIMAVSLARDDAFAMRLANVDLVSAGRAGLMADSGVSADAQEGLRKRLTKYLTDPGMELRTRLDAGLTLDQPDGLGFERRTSSEGFEYLWPPMAVIRAGTYWVGSDDDDPDAYEHEKPKHQVVVKSNFLLAKYPVTNAEYARFMAAGGYEDERWWPDGEARQWWLAKREDTQAADRARVVRGWSENQFSEFAVRYGWSDAEKDWVQKLRQGSWEEAVNALTPARHPALEKRPSKWDDELFNRALQPIVGVCAFEAEAYVRWLSAQAGQHLALATEAQWEIAARGTERRIWSYGQNAEPLAANTLALGLRRPSPVGVFADRETPEGVGDLSGNVWEWSASAWTESYRAEGRSDDLRVVRGGSWDSPYRRARGAYRGRAPLGGRGSALGFRLCFPSPQSEI